MKKKNIIMCMLLIGIWLGEPILVSAKGLPLSAESSGAQNSFILEVQQRPDLGGKGVFSYDSELSRGTIPGRNKDYEGSSGADMRSYSDTLGPSFDIPPSVQGGSPTSGPWWDRRSLGDPSVKDLSEMDKGGFAPPSSYTGSQIIP